MIFFIKVFRSFQIIIWWHTMYVPIRILQHKTSILFN